MGFNNYVQRWLRGCALKVRIYLRDVIMRRQKLKRGTALTIPRPNPTFSTDSPRLVSSHNLMTVSSTAPTFPQHADRIIVKLDRDRLIGFSHPIMTPTWVPPPASTMHTSCPFASVVKVKRDERNVSNDAAAVSSSVRISDGGSADAPSARRMNSIRFQVLTISATPS